MSDRCQKTTLNNTEAGWISLHEGVLQGTVFGLLIFNLYINDLSKQLTNSCNVVQYADEIILFCEDKSINTSLKVLQNFVFITVLLETSTAT